MKVVTKLLILCVILSMTGCGAIIGAAVGGVYGAASATNKDKPHD